MAQTDYVVLRQSPDRERGGIWQHDPQIYKATSASKAIRLAAESATGSENGEAFEGTFVAVPLRSWSPVKIGWEHTRRIVVRESNLTDPKVEVPAAA